jgi:hypothetical protein
VRPLFKAPREDGSRFHAVFWTTYAHEKPNEAEDDAGLLSVWAFAAVTASASAGDSVERIMK